MEEFDIDQNLKDKRGQNEQLNTIKSSADHIAETLSEKSGQTSLKNVIDGEESKIIHNKPAQKIKSVQNS